MERSSSLLVVLVFLVAGIPLSARAEDQAKTAGPDSPEATFRRDTACAGGAAAAQAHLDAGSTDQQKAHAVALSGMTRDVALKSGAAIGLSAPQIETKIAGFSANILDDLKKGPDTKKQEGELGRLLLNCALLHAMEKK